MLKNKFHNIDNALDKAIKLAVKARELGFTCFTVEHSEEYKLYEIFITELNPYWEVIVHVEGVGKDIYILSFDCKLEYKYSEL